VNVRGQHEYHAPEKTRDDVEHFTFSGRIASSTAITGPISVQL
jgi:hypothetical protein